MSFVVFLLTSQSMAKEIWVDPYVKRDGTHVRGHYRSINDSIETATAIVWPEPIQQERCLPMSLTQVEVTKSLVDDAPYVSLEFQYNPPGSHATEKFMFSCSPNKIGYHVSIRDIYHGMEWYEQPAWSEWYELSGKAWVGDEFYESLSLENVLTRGGSARGFVTSMTIDGESQNVKSDFFCSGAIKTFMMACQNINNSLTD